MFYKYNEFKQQYPLINWYPGEQLVHAELNSLVQEKQLDEHTILVKLFKIYMYKRYLKENIKNCIKLGKLFLISLG